MRKFLAVPAVLVFVALPAKAAKLPTLNITCPGIEMHVDKGTPTTINGDHAKLSRTGSNSFQATHEGVTISIVLAGDGTATASYTGKNGAHGACAAGS